MKKPRRFMRIAALVLLGLVLLLAGYLFIG